MAGAVSIVINRKAIDKYADYYFSQHPRARKKPIPRPYHESVNAWMIMKRPQMNALKQRWKEFIVWLVKEYGYTDFIITKCEIVQKTYFPDSRKHDVDNTVPKFILDGLVESGLIAQDDSTCIEKLTLTCGLDRKNPRTVLTIKVKEMRQKENDNEEDY